MTLVAVLSATSTVAPGYSYWKTSGGTPYTWASNTITLRPSSTGFPSGSKWHNALNTAVSEWNYNPSKLQFAIGSSASGTGKNGANNVYLVNSSYLIDWFGIDYEPAPAACVMWFKSGKIIETDIYFDLYYSWTNSNDTSNLAAYGGTKRSIRATAIHEMGHALGLGHESRTYNSMGTSQTHVSANGTTARFYPGENACHGAVFLYGLASLKREDVSVTHWKYLWPDDENEYSKHGRTCIYRSDGTTIASLLTGTSSDPVYQVSLGESVQLELTYENSGANTQSVKVNYYLSGDKHINTEDMLLDTRTPTMGRNTVYTFKHTLVIPTGLTRGKTYYLGAVVDPDDDIAEVREDNNATYVGIYIK